MGSCDYLRGEEGVLVIALRERDIECSMLDRMLVRGIAKPAICVAEAGWSLRIDMVVGSFYQAHPNDASLPGDRKLQKLGMSHAQLLLVRMRLGARPSASY